MKKVYCKDCKYFMSRVIRQPIDLNEKRTIFDGCKLEIEDYGHYRKPYIKCRNYPWSKNANNDCPDYKRKWWKFWLYKKEDNNCN